MKECSQPLNVIGVSPESPIAMSGDGKRLAFVCGNMSIFIMDLGESSFELKTTLYGHERSVLCLQFHPTDPAVLASGGPDGIFVWDCTTATTKKIIRNSDVDPDGHESDIECLAWTHGGNTLLTGSKDAYIKAWAADADFALLETITGHKASVMALSYCEAQRVVASAGRDSTIKIWDVSTLSPEWRARRADDKSISCSLQHNIDGHRGDVVSLSYASDASILVSGARDNTAKLWDTKTYLELRELRDENRKGGTEHQGDVRALSVVHGGGDDLFCLSASMDGQVRLFKLGSAEQAGADLLALGGGIGAEDEEAGAGSAGAESKRQEDEEAKALEMLLQSAGGATAEMEEGTTDALLLGFHAHPDGVAAMWYSPATATMVTASGGNSVRVWNMATLQRPVLVQEFVGHSAAVTDIHMFPGNDSLLSCSTDYHLHSYNKTTMQRYLHLDCDSSALALDIAPQQRQRDAFVLVGGNGYTIHAYSLRPGAFSALTTTPDGVAYQPKPHEFVSTVFRGHGGKVRCIAVHPDGNSFVSGGEDHRLLLWTLPETVPPLAIRRKEDDVPVAKPVSIVAAHSGHITGAAWSEAQQAGSRLATVSNDHSLKLWQQGTTMTGNPSLSSVGDVPAAHTAAITCVAWGRGDSNAVLFTGGWDRVLRVWNVGSVVSGEALAVLEGHRARITQVDCSPTGAHVVSAAVDHTARVWETSGDFACLCVYRHSEPVTAVSVDPTSVATGAENGMLRFWPIVSDPRYASHFEDYVGDEDEKGVEAVRAVVGDVVKAVAPAAIAPIGAAGAGAGAGAGIGEP